MLALRGLSTLQPPPKGKGDKPIDHVVELELNGQALAPLRWDGRDEVRRELQVAASRLKVRDNTLSLHADAHRRDDAGRNAEPGAQDRWHHREREQPIGVAQDAIALLDAGDRVTEIRRS